MGAHCHRSGFGIGIAVDHAPAAESGDEDQRTAVLGSSETQSAAALRNDTDVMASVLETARWAGMNFCDADVVVAFSGGGELAGLVMVFFQEVPPADPDNAARVLQSASRLVSLARDHWYMHERLVFDARHDALTGLPNRTVAEDSL